MNVGNAIVVLQAAGGSPQLSFLLSEAAAFAAKLLKVLSDQEAAMQNGAIAGPPLHALLAYAKTLPGWTAKDFPEPPEPLEDEDEDTDPEF